MTLNDLIARDGTNCGLCKKPIDFNVSCPHPFSATIGHIIPKSRGGSDCSSNLRIEHWGCNMKKWTYLDSELDPITLMPPDPSVDVVSYIIATEKHREGSRKGASIGGKIAGRISVENGRWAKLKTKEHQSSAGRIGGLIGGKRGRGHAAGIATLQRIRTFEHQQKAGRLGGLSRAYDRKIGAHVRWHISRGIKNINCNLCAHE